MAIQDYQRPYDDDFSFDRRSSTSSSLVSFHSQLRLTVSNTQSESELPERITIRKPSRPPSWFSGKRPPIRKISTERESSAAGAIPPARSRMGSESGVPIDPWAMYFDEGSDEVDQSEQIRFRGMARDSFPTSARQFHDDETRITFTGGNYVVPSPGSLVDPFRSPLPSSSLAPPRRTSRSLPSATRSSMTALYARRISSSSGPPPMRTPPPPSRPMPPVPSAAPSAEFFQRLVPKSIATLPTVLISPFKTSPRPSLVSQLRPSPRQSEVSSATDVSLSMFPPPPASVTVQSEYDYGASSPDFATSHPSMATTGVAMHGGAQFDLYPSRPTVVGGADVRYDITSMIVGLPSGPPRRPSLASSMGSPALGEEVGVIRQATSITSPSLSRNGSLDPPTRQQHPFSHVAVPSPTGGSTPSPSSSTGSSTAYDPTKPFEKPRPAPIVVGRPAFPASVAFEVGGRETLRKAGGAGKKIVLVRDQEVE